MHLSGGENYLIFSCKFLTPPNTALITHKCTPDGPLLLNYQGERLVINTPFTPTFRCFQEMQPKLFQGNSHYLSSYSVSPTSCVHQWATYLSGSQAFLPSAILNRPSKRAHRYPLIPVLLSDNELGDSTKSEL